MADLCHVVVAFLITKSAPKDRRGLVAVRRWCPASCSPKDVCQNGTVALMPFATVRLKQNLICLGQGRLRQVGERTEQVTISLTLGTLGWSFVPSNRPELRFKLLGENQRVVHEGTTPGVRTS